MRHTTFALMMAFCMLGCVMLCSISQWYWEQGCDLRTVDATDVYTPGTAELATTLPAGTAIRAEETVGEGWLEIEYMVGGQCLRGMVRAGTLEESPDNTTWGQ